MIFQNGHLGKRNVAQLPNIYNCSFFFFYGDCLEEPPKFWKLLHKGSGCQALLLKVAVLSIRSASGFVWGGPGILVIIPLAFQRAQHFLRKLHPP